MDPMRLCIKDCPLISFPLGLLRVMYVIDFARCVHSTCKSRPFPGSAITIIRMRRTNGVLWNWARFNSIKRLYTLPNLISNIVFVFEINWTRVWIVLSFMLSKYFWVDLIFVKNLISMYHIIYILRLNFVTKLVYVFIKENPRKAWIVSVQATKLYFVSFRESYIRDQKGR